MASKVRVAIVGLGFGAEFIPIYQNHPDAEMYAICRRNKGELDKVGDKFGIKARYESYEQVLKDPNVDAVHINSPIPDHAGQTLAALKAGKHVACTVPMATTIDECRQIVELQRQVGKVYMMMETVVYAREYLFVKEMYDKGELGRIQFLRGSHQQDMEGWPNYWPGLPPMWYATHCVSPCLALLSGEGKPALAEHVVCHGSGRIREELIKHYGSPFAVETATFRIKNSDVAAEVTRSLFDTARQYRESFDAYGSKRSFEWQQVENEEPVIHELGKPEAEIPHRVKVPDYGNRLPEGIRRFTQPAAIQDAEHLSFVQGGGHGGSHPHLVHAFLQAVQGRKPAFPDAPTSANWTMVGLCAHQSALKDGEKVKIPELQAAKEKSASVGKFTHMLFAVVFALSASGCQSKPRAAESAATRNQTYPLAGDRDAVENFFAAVRAGDAGALPRLVIPDYPNAIGGRTWQMWIEDCQNVQIRFGFRILDRRAEGDQAAVQVYLSNGEAMTFYLRASGGRYLIAGVDRTGQATTQP